MKYIEGYSYYGKCESIYEVEPGENYEEEVAKAEARIKSDIFGGYVCRIHPNRISITRYND